MAEIDADELERVAGANIDRVSLREALRYAKSATEDEERTEHHWTPEGENFMSRILLALYSELAHLRAPKGELEEARAMADMREWLGEEGSLRSATFSPISVKLKDYRAADEWTIVGRNDHTALAAALSRARGEGS